jgi:hypothetical protein
MKENKVLVCLFDISYETYLQRGGSDDEFTEQQFAALRREFQSSIADSGINYVTIKNDNENGWWQLVNALNRYQSGD